MTNDVPVAQARQLMRELAKDHLIIALVRRIVGKHGGMMALTNKELDAERHYVVHLSATPDSLRLELQRRQ